MAAEVARRGLRHRFTRPDTPKTNGKAECFIQTSLREWAYAHAYSHSHQRSAQLPVFLHNYNWHRPHHSLNLLSPISKLRQPLNNLLSLHRRVFLRLNFMNLCGLLAGSMTDSPALAFANTIAKSDAPSVAYATVYPLTMILRILLAQIIVLLFAR